MAKSACELRFPPDASAALMHRVLNCVEDIDRELRERGIGDIEPRDEYGTGTFLVRSRSARLSGNVVSVVRRQLESHAIQTVGDVVRVRSISKHAG